MRRAPAVSVGVLLLVGALAGCGGEPEPLEALPPLAPPDLCALLPPDATEGLVGTASRSEDGDPTAACALRGEGGRDAEVLVTWLQLEDEERARVVWESQCAGIDRARLSDADASVEGADETCAAAGTEQATDRASLALRQGREVVTVRVTTRDGQGPGSLALSQTLATGLLPELPAPQ